MEREADENETKMVKLKFSHISLTIGEPTLSSIK